MKDFALINSSSVVENVVYGDSLEFFSELFPDMLIVEVTDDTGAPYIGLEYSASLNKFKEFQPYEDWTFDEATFEWKAPSPNPGDGKDYIWSTALNSWIIKPENA
jgi:hypothetical protein